MKARNHVQGQKNLPEFMKDFHDQKDLFKTIWIWWGEKIESNHKIKWVDAHIFVIDYFLWFMGLHGYKLQKDKTKNVEFLDINESIQEIKDSKSDLLKSFLNKEK